MKDQITVDEMSDKQRQEVCHRLASFLGLEVRIGQISKHACSSTFVVVSPTGIPMVEIGVMPCEGGKWSIASVRHIFVNQMSVDI